LAPDPIRIDDAKIEMRERGLQFSDHVATKNYNFDIRVLLCDYLSSGRASGCQAIAPTELRTLIFLVSMPSIDISTGSPAEPPCHEIRYQLQPKVLW
jgi:hypothetical protein